MNLHLKEKFGQGNGHRYQVALIKCFEAFCDAGFKFLSQCFNSNQQYFEFKAYINCNKISYNIDVIYQVNKYFLLRNETIKTNIY